MTSRRVTIMLDAKVEERLRSIQANRILKLKKMYSFSSCLNDELKKRLKLK